MRWTAGTTAILLCSDLGDAVPALEEAPSLTPKDHATTDALEDALMNTNEVYRASELLEEAIKKPSTYL